MLWSTVYGKTFVVRAEMIIYEENFSDGNLWSKNKVFPFESFAIYGIYYVPLHTYTYTVR